MADLNYHYLAPVIMPNETSSEDGAEGDPLGSSTLKTDDFEYFQHMCKPTIVPVEFKHEISLAAPSSPLLAPNFSMEETNATIESNKKRARGAKPKAKQCSICERFFLYLSKHKNACLKRKPYVCPICGSSHTQKSNLNRHVFSKHGDIYHYCLYCSHKCKRKDKLKEHMKSHHTK